MCALHCKKQYMFIINRSSRKMLFSRNSGSFYLVQDGDAPNEIDTLSVMQWGQFVDHDITISPVPR